MADVNFVSAWETSIAFRVSEFAPSGLPFGQTDTEREREIEKERKREADRHREQEMARYRHPETHNGIW